MFASAVGRRADKRMMSSEPESDLHLDAVAPFEVVPLRTIIISLASGPGSLNPQTTDIQPEDGELVRRVYVSPTDPAEVGNTVTFDCEVT